MEISNGMFLALGRDPVEARKQIRDIATKALLMASDRAVLAAIAVLHPDSVGAVLPMGMEEYDRVAKLSKDFTHQLSEVGSVGDFITSLNPPVSRLGIIAANLIKKARIE